MKKALAFTLIFVFLFNFSACKSSVNSKNPETTETTNNVKPFLYVDLINDYKKILDFRLSDDFEEKYNNGTYLPDISDELKAAIASGNSEHWANMLAELPTGEEAFSIDYYGYILYDMNNDGIDELFWVRKDYSIIAIFTIYNETLTLLDAFWSRHRATINQQGVLITQGSGGAADSINTISDLENGELKEMYALYSESSHNTATSDSVSFYEQTEKGKSELTENEYREKLEKKFNFPVSDFWLSQDFKEIKN